MINLFIWFALLITAFIATLVVGKVGRAKPWDLFIASLVGLLVRLVQFIILGLFAEFTPGLGIPRILFGITITGVLMLGFLVMPFLTYSKDKSLREYWFSYGLFFYLGYFAFGFLQTYLWGVFF